jgi:hypothetical protein
MSQTEAMQLIKRTQCKLRLCASPNAPFLQSSVIAMASPKSGEKQVSVGQCKAKTKAREGGQFPYMMQMSLEPSRLTVGEAGD